MKQYIVLSNFIIIEQKQQSFIVNTFSETYRPGLPRQRNWRARQMTNLALKTADVKTKPNNTRN